MNLNEGIDTRRKLKDGSRNEGGSRAEGFEMMDLMILAENMRWSQERGGGDTC